MKFDRQIAEIDSVLKTKDENREKIITLSREIIRKSGSAVLAVHKKDEVGITGNIEAARQSLEAALEACKAQPEYFYVGPLPQAFQEFAEVNIFVALAGDQDIPSPNELRVPVESYITGLADAIGEMRRYALDSLRKDDFDEAERALKTMEEAYMALKSLDYPRAVVPNLKRKLDVNRRLVEETRGDVTLAHQGRLIRSSLEKAMKAGGRKGTNEGN